MRRLCATVLVFEAIVIGLAIPVAITIEHVAHRQALLAGGLLAGAAVLLAAGSVLQLAVIAAGVVVPAMFALGAIFAALWVIALLLGHRYRESA